MVILHTKAMVAWDSESFQRSRRKGVDAIKHVAVDGAMPVYRIARLSPSGLVDLPIHQLLIVIIWLLVAGGRFPV